MDREWNVGKNLRIIGIASVRPPFLGSINGRSHALIIKTLLHEKLPEAVQFSRTIAECIWAAVLLAEELLLRILPNCRLSSDQTILVLDDIGTDAKRIAIYFGKAGQIFRRQLCGYDIDHKLPFWVHFGKCKDQIAYIWRKILANQDH